ncbi:1-deoxy-D-xylulose-5-phosphate reductoisomerase [bacterium]|nr:1-deoxy-D-xylulose-5-phosphate reductoisomerase [bacterium]
MRQRLGVFGSTGSIGCNTLELARRFPERFEVTALTAGRNLALLRDQARAFCPQVLVVEEESAARQLATEFPGVEVLWGENGLKECAAWSGIDIASQGILGFAALAPTLELIRAGKAIALANKESLVVAGGLLREALEKSKARCIPVDSEHNAIYQLLQGRGLEGVESLVLTASGGPFWNRPEVSWETVTPEQAIRHPNWKMGPKISVDSATLMNKGLEVVEAHFLFNIPVERIEVWVHPQSIVHGAVWYEDGTCQAQLSRPDMKASIGHALGFPDRLPQAVKKLTLKEMSRLDFSEPDTARFPMLDLPRQALQAGQSCLVALNAGNEIAVAAFLEGRLSFSALPVVLRRLLDEHRLEAVQSLEDVLRIDLQAREATRNLLQRL